MVTIFTKYGVYKDATRGQGGGLVGHNILSMLRNWNDIKTALELLFRTEGPRRENRPTQDLMNHISKFFTTMSLLMRALLAMRYYLYATKPTDDEKEKCRLLALNIGVLWRKGLKISVPVKLHLLETHVCQQLNDLGSIGIFNEETIESSHKDDKKMNACFNNRPDWYSKESAKRSKKQRTSIPDVEKGMKELPANPRQYRPETQERKNQKIFCDNSNSVQQRHDICRDIAIEANKYRFNEH